jgi:hypothetical protein
MAETSQNSCKCGSKTTCYRYNDSVRVGKYFVFLCERVVEEGDIPLYCPFCGNPLENHSESCEVKK